MVKASNVVVELPKRTAVLVDERGVRTKVRGLFWLTLTTVVLGLVVVLASLCKTLATPSVPAPATPVMVASAAPAPACEAPAPPAEIVTSAEIPMEPEVDAGAPATPPGFPSLDRYP